MAKFLDNEVSVSSTDSEPGGYESEEIPLQHPRCSMPGTRKRLCFDKHEANESRVLEAVEKNNELLLSLVSHVKKTEKWLKVIEKQIDSTSSPSSDMDLTPGKRFTSRKKDVPIEVRVSLKASLCSYFYMLNYCCCLVTVLRLSSDLTKLILR